MCGRTTGNGNSESHRHRPKVAGTDKVRAWGAPICCSRDQVGYTLCAVTMKRLRGIMLLCLVVFATAGSVFGVVADLQWMQRSGVMLLVIVGLVALRDWMRAATQ